jgi:hypothetical protein
VIGVMVRTLLAPGKVEAHHDDHLGLKLAVARSRRSEKAPIRAGQRWPVERTNAWHYAFGLLQRCYGRREDVVDAFLDLADTIIRVRSLIRSGMDHLPAGTAVQPGDRHHSPIRASSYLIVIVNRLARRAAVPVVPQSLLYPPVTADTGSANPFIRHECRVHVVPAA